MNLSHEVARFKQWALKLRSPDGVGIERWHGDGEWECDYPDWAAIYGAVEQLVSSKKELSDSEVQDLLYILARDNEDERVLELISAFPRVTITLCDAGISRAEHDAKWQLAVALGRIGGEQERVRLEAFLSDADEYVRRRASLALQGLQARTESRPNQAPLPTPGKCPPSNHEQLPGAADL